MELAAVRGFVDVELVIKLMTRCISIMNIMAENHPELFISSL